MGWAGVLVPEEHGGAGFGYVGAGLIAEEVGRNLSATPLLSTAVLAVTAGRHIGEQVVSEGLLGLEHGVELHRDELREGDHLAEDLVLEDEVRHGVQDDREHPPVRDDRRGALLEAGRGERQRRIRPG